MVPMIAYVKFSKARVYQQGFVGIIRRYHSHPAAAHATRIVRGGVSRSPNKIACETLNYVGYVAPRVKFFMSTESAVRCSVCGARSFQRCHLLLHFLRTYHIHIVWYSYLDLSHAASLGSSALPLFQRAALEQHTEQKTSIEHPCAHHPPESRRLPYIVRIVAHADSTPPPHPTFQ